MKITLNKNSIIFNAEIDFEGGDNKIYGDGKDIILIKPLPLRTKIAFKLFKLFCPSNIVGCMINGGDGHSISAENKSYVLGNWGGNHDKT
jgi:hypothetical protein